MNIQTIVYLDLESTGLRESGRPRISEISLLAVNMNDFLSGPHVLVEAESLLVLRLLLPPHREDSPSPHDGAGLPQHL